MIVRVEPKDWSMYSVLLYFDKNKPDAEDGDARSYLAEHNLEPKRTLDTEVDGREFEVLSFGGCYIGQHHMKALSEIQRSVVERELLVAKIAEYLREGPDTAAREQAASMEDAQFQAAVETLVQQFQCESSFGKDDEGYIQVTLDAAAVQERF